MEPLSKFWCIHTRILLILQKIIWKESTMALKITTPVPIVQVYKNKREKVCPW